MGVESWGTGRADYSRNVEFSTEPLIRGPQTQYSLYREYLNTAANSNATVSIDTGADVVVMLYDTYLVANKNVLIEIELEAKGTGGSYATIFKHDGYQIIHHPMQRGFPVFQEYRYTYYNKSSEEIDLLLTINGLYTAEKEYYLSKGDDVPI